MTGRRRPTHARGMASIPAQVTRGDLEAASQRVGDRRGWDFSRIRAEQDPAPWSYDDVVAAAGPRRRVLDIGTGGGEVLRRLQQRGNWTATVAIDHSTRMAETATENLGDRSVVAVGDSAALPARSRAFDLVLDRHASVNPAEVARVLAEAGVFVTQQVGPRNTQSIFDAFGWGSNWDQFANDDPPPRRCRELAAEFEALGCSVERLEEYEIGYAFLDLDSLVFFLRAAPMPEDFDPAEHLDGINRLLATSLSDRGIETTEHRELLVVHRR